MSCMIQPCAAGILDVIGCFVVIVGTAAMSIVSANHGTLTVFQDKHPTTQAFVGPVHLWSLTSLVT